MAAFLWRTYRKLGVLGLVRAVCHQIHHVNPHTGVVLGEKAK